MPRFRRSDLRGAVKFVGLVFVVYAAFAVGIAFGDARCTEAVSRRDLLDAQLRLLVAEADSVLTNVERGSVAITDLGRSIERFPDASTR